MSFEREHAAPRRWPYALLCSVNRNQAIQYTIVVTNHGPAVATASVTDTFPAQLTVGTWTCTATAGSSCGSASGTSNLATSANRVSTGDHEIDCKGKWVTPGFIDCHAHAGVAYHSANGCSGCQKG